MLQRGVGTIGCWLRVLPAYPAHRNPATLSGPRKDDGIDLVCPLVTQVKDYLAEIHGYVGERKRKSPAGRNIGVNPHIGRENRRDLLLESRLADGAAFDT